MKTHEWMFSAFLVLFVAVVVTLSFLGPTALRKPANAQGAETRYYYTTEIVVVDEEGNRTIYPFLLHDILLQPGEGYASSYNVSPFYVLRFTATPARHNTIFSSSGSFLGNELPTVKSNVRARVEAGALRVSLQNELRRLEGLGCQNLPADAVDIIGKGDIQC